MKQGKSQPLTGLALLLPLALTTFQACGDTNIHHPDQIAGGKGGEPASGATGKSRSDPSKGAISAHGGTRGAVDPMPVGMSNSGVAGEPPGGADREGVSGQADGGSGGQDDAGGGGEASLAGAGGCAGVDCAPKQQAVTVGSTEMVSRHGFSAQCKEWNGLICTKPWLQIPASVLVPTANALCLDDTTSLRPVWYSSEGVEEASTFCWITTGDSQYKAISTDGPSAEECGWMYGTFTSNNDESPSCSTFRRYSEVDSPENIANIIWSFDQLSECRVGTFSTFECNWRL